MHFSEKLHSLFKLAGTSVTQRTTLVVRQRLFFYFFWHFNIEVNVKLLLSDRNVHNNFYNQELHLDPYWHDKHHHWHFQSFYLQLIGCCRHLGAKPRFPLFYCVPPESKWRQSWGLSAHHLGSATPSHEQNMINLLCSKSNLKTPFLCKTKSLWCGNQGFHIVKYLHKRFEIKAFIYLLAITGGLCLIWQYLI